MLTESRAIDPISLNNKQLIYLFIGGCLM